MQCNLCGFNDNRYLFTKNSYRIVRCLNCSLLYSEANLKDEDIRQLYDSRYFVQKREGYQPSGGYMDYLEGEREYLKKNSRQWWKDILKVKTRGRILDVGCAMGYFLEMAAEGWEAYGVEISEYASNYARKVPGLRVFTGTLHEAEFPDNYFDIITMWGVLDQLNDPLGNLLEIKRILKRDGLFIVRLPKLDSFIARVWGKKWQFFSPPIHLFYFTEETIRLMLEKAGFEVIKIRRMGKLTNLDYILFRFSNLYPSRLFLSAYNLIRRLKIGRINFYLNIGDVMHVYGRKV